MLYYKEFLHVQYVGTASSKIRTYSQLIGYTVGQCVKYLGRKLLRVIPYVFALNFLSVFLNLCCRTMFHQSISSDTRGNLNLAEWFALVLTDCVFLAMLMWCSGRGAEKTGNDVQPGPEAVCGQHDSSMQGKYPQSILPLSWTSLFLQLLPNY